MYNNAASSDPTPTRYFYLRVDENETHFSLKLPGQLDLSDGVQRYVALLKLSMSQRLINVPAQNGQYTMEFWDASFKRNDWEHGDEVPFTGGIYHDRQSLVAGLNQLFFDLPSSIIENPTLSYSSVGVTDLENGGESERGVYGKSEEDYHSEHGIILTLAPNLVMSPSLALAKLLGISYIDAKKLMGHPLTMSDTTLASERTIKLDGTLFRETDLFPSQFHLLCPQILSGAPIYSSRPGGMSPILATISAPSRPSDFSTGSILNVEPQRPLWLPISTNTSLSELHVSMVDANEMSGEVLPLKHGFGHLLIAISNHLPSL